MKAMVLAGGFGTRLRPLSCTRPKLLFPVGNKPLLDWTLKRLAEGGVEEVVLAVNYMSEAFRKRYGKSKYGMKILYSREERPLKTGGPIKQAEELIGYEKPFLVLNGDILTNINYAELTKKHTERNAIATIAVYKVENPSRYGVAELTENDQIVSFVEKPGSNEVHSKLVNAGIYVLDPKIFEYIPAGKPISIEHEIFPTLVDEGRLFGHPFEGLWIDIGEPKDYLRANRIVLDTEIKKSKISRNVRLEGKVKFKDPTVISRGVTIGEESRIGPHVSLGENVSVGKEVRIENSVIFPGATISEDTSIEGTIIGERAFIGRGVKIEDECLIGDHAVIEDNVTLTREVTVCPSKIVSESVLSPGRIM